MKEKICSKCGRKGPLWTSKPPLCKWCAGKSKPNLIPCTKTSILKSKKAAIDNKTYKKPHAESQEEKEWRNKRNKYYLEAITDNIQRNGICRCDECNNPIRNPKGRNVCHIVGSGANKLLYLDKRNNFILGKGELFEQCDCGVKFDDRGMKETMKIYPKYLEIRETLNNEYYTS